MFAFSASSPLHLRPLPPDKGSSSRSRKINAMAAHNGGTTSRARPLLRPSCAQLVSSRVRRTAKYPRWRMRRKIYSWASVFVERSSRGGRITVCLRWWPIVRGEIFMVDRENENCEKNLLWGCSESMTVPPRCCARFYRNIFLNTECRYIYRGAACHHRRCISSPWTQNML